MFNLMFGPPPKLSPPLDGVTFKRAEMLCSICLDDDVKFLRLLLTVLINEFYWIAASDLSTLLPTPAQLNHQQLNKTN